MTDYDTKKFTFKCACCGNTHEGSPSVGYDAPYYYHILKEDDKQKIAHLTSDLCTIENPDGKDYFIRVILEIPVTGVKDEFMWGVWISVSQTNYEKYVENFNIQSYTDHYFGWFSNKLPDYPDTLSLKTRACVQSEGDRPVIELEECDHQLYYDLTNGISWDKAVRLMQLAIHGNNTDA